MAGAEAEQIVGALIDRDFLEIVRGPREGRTLSLSGRISEAVYADSDVVSLAMRLPLLRAMARADLLGEDLLRRVQDAAAESDDRAIEALLKFCRKTSIVEREQLSPDAAVRWWFASLATRMRDCPRENQSAYLRDARRMLTAILNRDSIWVSGDWSDYLCEMTRLAVLRLAGTDGSLS
ncbi:hypothetical protein [Microbacterium sp. NPDC089695]|uniref:hypothetical protein n=1 Tax=Microbacterium sp. NPDC089695 TaxID=3364198 RepID=UPI0038051A19